MATRILTCLAVILTSSYYVSAVPNVSPTWVDGTIADGGYLGVCKYEASDPQTAGGGSSLTYTFEAEDENSGDGLVIHFSTDSGAGTSPSAATTVTGQSDANNAVDGVKVSATRELTWTPTTAERDACPQVASTVEVYVDDNSGANGNVEAADPTESEHLTVNLVTRTPPTLTLEGGATAGETIEAQVDCEVSFSVVATDCNEDETLTIYVLEDPGLPNGASVGSLVTLTGGDLPSGVAVAAKRDFSWTPIRNQAGRTYSVCFTSRDDSSECEEGGWYARSPACVSIHVGEPDLYWSGERVLRRWEGGGGPGENVVTTPITSGEVISESIGCSTYLMLNAYDNSSSRYCVDVVPEVEIPLKADGTPAILIDNCYHSDPLSRYDPALSCRGPYCESGVDGEGGVSPVDGHSCTRTIRFSPTRGDEGIDYNICFLARDMRGEGDAPLRESRFCLTFRANKCKYCIGRGETLHQVSSALHIQTNWLRLWNSNGNDDNDPETTTIEDPDRVLFEADVINVGPIYQIEVGDTLEELASRFSTTEDNILSLNPDVKNRADLTAGQELCIAPCTDKPGPFITY